MLKIQRNSKGFTLIELLIVIAIIGILAAVAIPSYTGYTKKAKVAEVVHAMGAIKNAVCVYYSENGVRTIDAADAATIKTNYGVDVPINRAAFAYVGGAVAGAGGTSTITATFANIGSGVDGQTLIISSTDYKNWTWSGSVDASYKPKQ